MSSLFKSADQEVSFRVHQLRIEDPAGNAVVAVRTSNSRYALFDPNGTTREQIHIAPIKFEPGHHEGVHLRGFIFNKPSITNGAASVTSPIVSFEMENGETIAVTRVDTSHVPIIVIGKKLTLG